MKKSVFLSKSNKCHEPFANALEALLKENQCNVYTFGQKSINSCEYLIIIPQTNELDIFKLGKGLYSAIEEFKDKSNIYVASNLDGFYNVEDFWIENEHDWTNYGEMSFGEYVTLDELLKQKTLNKSNMIDKLKELGEDNKDALLVVSKVKAGEIVLNNAISLLKDKLPGGYGILLDTTVGKLLVANLVAFAVNTYLPDNNKARIISEALLEGSYATLIESFNIEDLFSSITKGVNFKNILKEID